MNIPQDTLQQVADAAFLSSNGGMMGLLTCNKKKNHVFWHEERYERRSVIQHALSNPALSQFLSGGIGEYTDMEIADAWRSANHTMPFVSEIKRFLSALPRRESQALVDLKSDLDGWKDRAVSLEGQVNEAITRAEKAEAELSGLLEAANEESRKDHVKYSQLANKLEEAKAELTALKSAELGILRHLSEMPETVPEGCIVVTGGKDYDGDWTLGDYAEKLDTHFAILRLPAVEPTPPAQAEPAAQVPLGPEDCPPGSVLKALSWKEYEWRSVSHVYFEGVLLDNCPTTHSWIELEANWQINTSIPDAGRWDANAWRPCSKPGKEVPSENTTH